MTRIRLRYVAAFRNKARKSGIVRYYFRRRGHAAIPLPGIPGSEEFMAAYAAALATLPQSIEVGESRTAPGTINALAVDYYRSQAWGDLAPDTKRKRWRIIEAFRLKHGDKRVAFLRREHIQIMLKAIERPSTRRDRLKAIRGLVSHAVPTMIAEDPTDGISVKLPKSKGHHSWTDDEIERYRAHWQLGTQQRLVMEFALETTSRKGEVVKLGPQHVRGGRIRIERTHGSEDVDIPISPELQGMRRLAEAGNTAHELMAISGHKTLSEVQRYTSAADKKRLADSGMAKMKEETKRDANYTNIDHPLHKQIKKANNNNA